MVPDNLFSAFHETTHPARVQAAARWGACEGELYITIDVGRQTVFESKLAAQAFHPMCQERRKEWAVRCGSGYVFCLAASFCVVPGNQNNPHAIAATLPPRGLSRYAAFLALLSKPTALFGICSFWLLRFNYGGR